MVIKNPLMQLFGQSPFKPLQDHFKTVLEAANEVPGLLLAAQDNTSNGVGESRDRIYALENESDSKKIELRSHHPKTMYLPVDRR